MNKYFNTITTLLVALVVVFTAIPSHAKLASPPPQLTAIFKDIAEFESAFKSDKWDDALKVTGKIDTTFKQMLPQLKKDIKGNIETNYTATINGLKQSLTNQNQDATQKYFVELHKLIFSLIDQYEYKRPPVFTLINKYLGEAHEAIESKSYKRVVSEMDEVSDLFSYAENHLEGKEAKLQKIADIKGKIKEIRAAGVNKKGDVAKKGIESLRKMLADLIKA